MAQTCTVHPLDPDLAHCRAPGALVVGGDYRGLGIVRSLGRRGIPVHVLLDSHKISGFSRYCRARSPWPNAGESAQLECLLRLGANECNGWTLFPTADETAALVSRHHAALAKLFVLTCPPWEQMEWAYDKRLTYRVAGQFGIPVPRTFYPRRRAEVETLPCNFPALLKPAIKEGFNPFVHNKGLAVRNRTELLTGYDVACTLVDPSIVMVQELIPGGGEAQFSFAALCDQGEPLASITARRTRQFPVDLGRSSTFVETIENREVEIGATALLRATSYTGIVEVEFKYDARDRSYRLLDVNPRIWGWHTLAQRAGVDFPYLAWQVARGQEVDRVRASPGVRWIRMITDVPAAATSILNGTLSLRQYLRSFRGPLERAMFAADDPLPALAEAPVLAWLALRRRAI